MKEKGDLRHDEDLDGLGSGTIHFRRQNMIRNLVETFSVAPWGGKSQEKKAEIRT